MTYTDINTFLDKIDEPTHQYIKNYNALKIYGSILSIQYVEY